MAILHIDERDKTLLQPVCFMNPSPVFITQLIKSGTFNRDFITDQYLYYKSRTEIRQPDTIFKHLNSNYFNFFRLILENSSRIFSKIAVFLGETQIDLRKTHSQQSSNQTTNELMTKPMEPLRLSPRGFIG